ncbi:MAG: hypothetical protein ACOCYB_05145 [Alkalispirochaeta sp.]
MHRTRGAVYRELYHFLTGERHGGRPSAATARDLPRPIARSLVHFYSLLKSGTLESLTENVADLVADAVSRWFQDVWQDLDEGMTRSTLRPAGSASAPETRLEEYRRRFPSAESEWRVIAHRLHHCPSSLAVQAVDRLMEETRIVCEDLERETTQERALRRAVTPLADHLNRVIPDAADADRRCRTLFRRPAEWDMFAENPAQVPWHRLEHAHARLEADSDMQRLTEALVRGISQPEVRLVWRKTPVESVSTHESDAGLGDIDGLHGTSSVQSALPSEIALLATPPTEDLFARKLAEQDVLALHSRRIRVITTSRTIHAWKRVRPKFRPGPLVVCLDTSGSMDGMPMQIAESILFGMVRSAIAYQRRIYIFAVRGRLRRVALEPPTHERPSVSGISMGEIPNGAPGPEDHASGGPMSAGSPSRVREGDVLALHRFFDAPHTGGADISPALEAALEQVGAEGESAVADVVVVSDMQFPRISATHQVGLDNLQRRGVAIAHAITIGEQAMRDPMNLFDHRWHYNTGQDVLPRGRRQHTMVGFRYQHIPI